MSRNSSGCGGCFGVLALLMVLGWLSSAWPYLLIIGVIALVIYLLVRYGKKQQYLEENRVHLENQALKKQQQELQVQAENIQLKQNIAFLEESLQQHHTVEENEKLKQELAQLIKENEKLKQEASWDDF